jgi:hypothetical protein
MVGLLPLCALTATDKWQRERVPGLVQIMVERTRRMPELLGSIRPIGPGHFGVAERGILGLVNQDRLRRILTRMLDENEFLSPYGIQSLSRYHADHRYVFSANGQMPGELFAGGFGQRHVRRQLQLAGADPDAGQRADHSRPDALFWLLR